MAPCTPRSRRAFLHAISVAGGGLLAGCSDQDRPRSPTSTPTRSSPTQEATRSPTATATPEPGVAISWHQADGPPGGPVTGIQYSAADPRTMYAATPTAGVYYSDDGGVSWTQGPSHMHHMGTVRASPHDPEVAYGGGERTTDGGLHWDRFVVNGVDGPTNAWTIEFDPLDPDRLYAGIESGVAVSDDGGSSWTQVALELDGERYGARRIDAVANDGDVLLWASDGGRVFRSRDRGRSWSVVAASRELPHQLSMGLAVERLNPERGYLALNGHTIYRIGEDEARSVSTDLPSLAFPGGAPTLDLSADGATLYAVARVREGEAWGRRRLLAYDTAGASLARLDPAREPYSVVTHPDDAAVVSIGDETGVLTSRDRGETWEDRSEGLIDSYLTAVAVNDARSETVLAGTECSGGLFVSDDRGETWRWERSGIPDHHDGVWGEHYVMHLAARGDRAYATTASGLLLSDDGGESWSMLETEFSGQELTHLHGLALHPTDPDTVYVGTGRLDAGGNPDAFDGTHIWKTTDGGTTWAELAQGFPTEADTVVQHILVNPHDPSIVYVGTNARDYLHGGNPPGEGRGLFKSTDGGGQWASVDTPVANVNALAIDGGEPETGYLASDRGIYRTTDGGRSWTTVHPSFSHGLATHPAHPGLVFASIDARRRRVVFSPDFGAHWYDGGLAIQTGYREPPSGATAAVPYHRRKVITWLALDDTTDRLYASTQGAGLWQADVSPVFDLR